MFSAIQAGRTQDNMPQHGGISPSDREILSSFWHPVALVSEITDKPFPACLLDVALVLYRTSGGITVSHDICPHRGTRLSRGWVSDDRLVCPMHGLAFDGEGACRSIPSAPVRETPISGRLSLRTVQSVERYGLVWACLSGQPAWPLPEWPAIGIGLPDTLHLQPETWHAAASRHVENFNDVAHFPFVHRNSFGGAPAAPLAPLAVRTTQSGLAFEFPHVEAENIYADGSVRPGRSVTYEYELTFPFSTLLRIRQDDGTKCEYLADTVCPVSATQSRIFQMVSESTGRPDPEYWLRDMHLVNEEDRRLVEEQRPEMLPLDLRDEGHIPADVVSIQYRSALVSRFGLGRRFTS